jgi:outer membrane receptor protein involved in Fe transport
MNFNKKFKLKNKLKLVTVIGSLCAGGISAQEISAESVESTESTEGVEVILVTAGKRGATRVQDIPLSISAVSEDQISKRGLVGMDDYMRSIPATNFLDRGAGRNGIIVRGVTASPQTDATVGVYVDETPLTGLGSASPGSGGNPDLKFVDMQRIEVLRGPQGTLYGDGSIAGTVRAIPNAPDLNYFSAKVSGSLSSTADKGGDNTSLRGVVNLPVVDDTFAVRIVAYDYDNSGYYESVSGSNADKQIWAQAFGGIATDKDDVGSDEYTGVRITALWQVTDNFDAALTYMAQDIEQSGIPESFMNLGGTRRAPFQKLDGSDEALGIDLDVTNLKMNWKLDSFILTSSTSKAETETLQDRDVGLFFGPLIGVDDIPLFLTDSGGVESFTQELRLSTDLSGAWQFLLGAFYQDVEKRQLQDFLFEGEPTLDPFGGELLFVSALNEDLQQLAFFGEVSFDLTDNLTAVAGIRFYDYEQTYSDTSNGLFNDGYSETNLKSDDSGETYKVSLTYQPNKSMSLYGTFAQGFRLGGPHPLVPTSICEDAGIVPDEIDSDELDSFEVGAKFTFSDHATLNVSAFYVDWTGIPVERTLECGVGVTLNAGEAESKGIEVDGQVVLSDIWHLNYSVSYIGAELTEDAPGLGLSGDRLPGSPEFQASLGVQADFEVLGRPVFARADIAHVGEYFNNLQEIAPNVGDYTTVNLSIGVEINDVISLDFFARNLSGEEGLTWVETEIGDGRANFIRPRTIGIEFRARFD